MEEWDEKYHLKKCKYQLVKIKVFRTYWNCGYSINLASTINIVILNL